MIKKVCLLFLFLLVCAFNTNAKTVKITLIDNSEIQGTVIKETRTHITIRTVGGVKRYDKRTDTKHIKTILSKEEIYEKLLKRLDLSKIESHLKLAKWCLKKNLLTKRFHHLNKVIELDPDNDKAHRALGHEQYEKKWIENGEVKTQLLWVSKKQKEKLLVEEKDLAEQIKTQKAKGNLAERRSAGEIISNKKYIRPAKMARWEREFFMKYIPNLGSKTWRKRQIAMKTLISQTFSHKVPPLLFEIAQIGSPLAMESAIEALTMMKYAPAAPLFEEKALEGEAEGIKIKALYGLGVIGGSASVPVLLKALDDEYKLVIDEAILALEKITFLTYDYLGIPDIAEVKQIYEKWFQENAGKSREEILIHVMQNGPELDRIKAVELLFKKGAIETLKTLIELLSSKDIQVQAEANSKLKELTGQDFDFDPFTTSKKLKEKWIKRWDKWYYSELRTGNEDGYQRSGKQTFKSFELLNALGGKDIENEKANQQIRSMKRTFAIPLLIKGLDHENFYIRIKSFSLLKEITDQHEGFGYDPGEDNKAIRINFINKWEVWFSKNRTRFEE